jgi:hypothetical protein
MRVVGVLVVSGLLATACGGGSDSADPSPTTAPPSATTPDTPPPATDAPAPDSTQPAPPPTEPVSTEPPTADSVIVESSDGNLSIRIAGAEHASAFPRGAEFWQFVRDNPDSVAAR